MQLTDSKIRSLKPKDKDYKVFDGGGLFLLVKRTNKKYWRIKYRFDGKERQFAIGVYPKITLKNARKQLNAMKEQLDAGIDPSQARQESKQKTVLKLNNSFEVVAQEWFNTKVIDKSESHRKRTQGYLQRELNPFIGHKQINDITAVDILNILKVIETRGVTSTAHRIKQVCSLIFRYGIATGRLTSDPTIHLSGALKPHRHKHFAALTKPSEVAELMHTLQNYQGGFVVQHALKLSPLLMCRPGELRHLEWTEIDFDKALIEISAEKMKMDNSHLIPLSQQAIGILKSMQAYSGHGKYVFPSARGPSRPISDNTVRVALRTMGYDKDTMTAHGFRAMARTLLDEVLRYPVEWIEQQLAHAVKDPLGRAYNRTKHLEQRVVMMQDWADYLEWLEATYRSEGNVTGYQSKVHRHMETVNSLAL